MTITSKNFVFELCASGLQIIKSIDYYEWEKNDYRLWFVIDKDGTIEWCEGLNVNGDLQWWMRI